MSTQVIISPEIRKDAFSRHVEWVSEDMEFHAEIESKISGVVLVAGRGQGRPVHRLPTLSPLHSDGQLPQLELLIATPSPDQQPPHSIAAVVHWRRRPGKSSRLNVEGPDSKSFSLTRNVGT